MTALNLSLLGAFDLVKYFTPSTENEDALYQALKDEEFDKQQLENEIEDLTDKVWELEKKLKELEEEHEDKIEKLEDINFELSEKIAELEKENEK
jgi:predicted  nucleic acid-binding Zn-ribbon protein